MPHSLVVAIAAIMSRRIPSPLDACYDETERRKQSRLPRLLFIPLGLVVLFGGMAFWPGASISLADRAVPPGTFACRVSSITDGDTFRCSDGTRVRLHAVAARENDETCSPGHPCSSASAAAATAKLTELALGQTLQCEQTGMSYDRITAICKNEDSVEINCAMVASGTTVIWPRYDQQRHICQSR